MTLNLWGYFDWKNRKDTIISLVRDQDPDIIAFQESQTNGSFSDWAQSDYIADRCGYKYRATAPTYKRDGQPDVKGGMTAVASHGLAIIAKYPIITSEAYFLDQHPDHDEVCSVLFCKVDTGAVIDVCNVHFGNSDVFADRHLKEVMDLCYHRRIRPLLLGDFNIFDLSAYANSVLRGYTISTDVADYMSMPKDKGTLDYIVTPPGCSIKRILCPDLYVSDHRALLADIDLRPVA